MIKALIYCRVSSERQVKEGHGLDSQEKRCRDYANHCGYRILKVFKDGAKSGGLFDRPEMKNLLRFLDEQHSKEDKERIVVIFDDLKRFARDVIVHFQLKTEIYGRNGRVESPNFKFEESPEGKYVETIMAAGAELERNQNKIQVKQRMKARLEMGYWPFCMPPCLVNKKDPVRGKVLVGREPFAAIYKQAIEQFADGRLRIVEDVQQFVIKELNKIGIKSHLSMHGARDLLTNPLNFGYIEYRPWGVPFAKAQHDGIVDPKLYEIVQSRFSGKPKPRLRADYNDDFPLRGIVVCASCGKPITGSWNKGNTKRYPNYACKTRGCPFRWKVTKKWKIEPEFLSLLKETKLSNGVVDLTTDVLNDVWKQSMEIYEADKIQHNDEKRETERQIEVFKGRVAKTLDEEMVVFYETEIKRLLKKSTEERDQNFDRHYTSEEFGTASRKVLGTLKDPVGMWQSPDYRDKRTIAYMYFDQKIPYDYNKGFGTPTLASPIALMKELSEQKVPDVEMGRVNSRVKKQPLDVYKLS